MPEIIPDYYYRKRGHIMGFKKKTWKNRIAEYINRRLITMEDGSTNLVTVARDEGTISQEGDAFNAANMNDLEDRIEAGFDEINRSLTDKANALVQKLHPVGSWYFSTVATNPVNIFGFGTIITYQVITGNYSYNVLWEFSDNIFKKIIL